MTLNQLWVLQEIATGRLPESPDPDQRRKDHRKMILAIDRLQKALNVTLLRAHSKPGGSPSDLLTPEGIELIDIVGRFFDDLDAFGQSHTNHGPSIRVASSTTLLHWLVLPSIRDVQRRAAKFGEPRPTRDQFQAGRDRRSGQWAELPPLPVCSRSRNNELGRHPDSP